nr:FAD-dependent 5-carboxymethylaminomethyl-2-thiouridine(34) oxidoreductase MnmC [Ramlibacter aurantiacus]
MLKALVRLCRRGTRLEAGAIDDTFARELQTAGFVWQPGEPLQAVYDPAWAPRGLRSAGRTPERAIVIGAGLAGAAVAASLARRGWQVEVLDAADQPASGASALPAGLMAPHLSPDDNLLSRLSRCGNRLTLQQAHDLLREGEDWSASGTLEHRAKAPGRLVGSTDFAADWSRAATPQENEKALLHPHAPSVWHAHAAWIRPAALVHAWLRQPGITWRGGQRVDRLERAGNGHWRVLDAHAREIDRAPLVVIAAAIGSAELASRRVLLQPVRGQVSWAPHESGIALPPTPVNGNGHFLPSVPVGEGRGWMCGSSYGRGDTALDERASEHLANFERLRQLLPLVATQLAATFAAERVKAWTGVRCASTDRRPLAGELEPGLWLSTAMGSRGLTFAALCAELLAARLHEEPLPVPLSWAMGLDVRRQLSIPPAEKPAVGDRSL